MTGCRRCGVGNIDAAGYCDNAVYHQEHRAKALAKYKLLIGPLRARARELGYALAVHGSVAWDIDIVAVPWAPEAVPARELAEALRDRAAELNGGMAYLAVRDPEDEQWQLEGSPGMKPHGRLCWSYHLGGGPYIDLSVMPRAPSEEPGRS